MAVTVGHEGGEEGGAGGGSVAFPEFTMDDGIVGVEVKRAVVIEKLANCCAPMTNTFACAFENANGIIKSRLKSLFADFESKVMNFFRSILINQKMHSFNFITAARRSGWSAPGLTQRRESGWIRPATSAVQSILTTNISSKGGCSLAIRIARPCGMKA